jgi:hypothetical protein
LLISDSQQETEMNSHRSFVLTAILASAVIAGPAAALEPIHASCQISASNQSGKFRLHIDSGECDGDHRHCGSNFSEESFDRFTGISVADLMREGAHLTATLSAEAGTFTCSGEVHDGSLVGQSVFTPDSDFAARMDKMGFANLDSEKLQAYAFVDVQSRWARSLQQDGIHGMTTDNLIAMRIFKVDPTYVQSITALGYDLPNADQLIGLRVQGVDASEIREIRSLGFEPSLDEMIQIRIFQVTPDFIRRMEARGLKNLTIAKLVQIRIFKLAD